MENRRRLVTGRVATDRGPRPRTTPVAPRRTPPGGASELRPRLKGRRHLAQAAPVEDAIVAGRIRATSAAAPGGNASAAVQGEADFGGGFIGVGADYGTALFDFDANGTVVGQTYVPGRTECAGLTTVGDGTSWLISNEGAGAFDPQGANLSTELIAFFGADGAYTGAEPFGENALAIAPHTTGALWLGRNAADEKVVARFPIKQP